MGGCAAAPPRREEKRELGLLQGDNVARDFYAERRVASRGLGPMKKVSGRDLARKMVRDWPDDVLMKREPHELAYTYGVSRSEAEKIFKEERLRRDL